MNAYYEGLAKKANYMSLTATNAMGEPITKELWIRTAWNFKGNTIDDWSALDYRKCLLDCFIIHKIKCIPTWNT